MRAYKESSEEILENDNVFIKKKKKRTERKRKVVWPFA